MMKGPKDISIDQPILVWKNIPLDKRTFTKSLAEMDEFINYPYVGMVFYSQYEDNYYKVLSVCDGYKNLITNQVFKEENSKYRRIPGYFVDKFEEYTLKGNQSHSIVNAYVNEEYHLIIEYFNGESVDAGYVRGASGFSPTIKENIANVKNVIYKLDIKYFDDELKEYIEYVTPNLRGNDGYSVKIIGSLDSVEDLKDIENKSMGEGYLIDGYLWIYYKSEKDDDKNKYGYINVGRLRGNTGPAGRGIKDIKINSSGFLSILYDNSETYEILGQVVYTPTIKENKDNDETTYKLDISFKDSEGKSYSFTTPNLRGNDGTSIKILGEKSSTDELNDIQNPKIGDCWIINGYLWVFSDSTKEGSINGFINAGKIQGPSGNGIQNIVGNYNNKKELISITFIYDNGDMKKIDVGDINGKDGADGKNGLSAYEVAVKNGFYGSEETWLESLKGEQGEKGSDGKDGKNGNDGKSAYESAVEKGFEGSEEDWLNSLKGKDGKDGTDGEDGQRGADGASAYDIAKKNGYIGTEEDWLNSLKGKDGKDGENGQDGTDGQEIELRTNDDVIQWKYVNSNTWNDLIQIDLIKGKDGKSIEFGEVSSKSVESDKEPSVTIQLNQTLSTDEKNIYDISFSIPKGEIGINGTDGREIELQATDSSIQWRYVGEEDWNDLVTIEAITGPKGDKGENGTDGQDGKQIELRTSETHIQWKYSDDEEWNDLVSKEDLTGPKGDKGEQGEKGTDGRSIVSITFKSSSLGDEAGIAGATDTYEILFSDDTTTEFIVKNGTALTLDTEMSDDSSNGVENKVIKKYIDETVNEASDLAINDVKLTKTTKSIDDLFIPGKIVKTTNETTGKVSTGELFNSAISATGDNSHAEGNGTIASGICSHAEGNGTNASGSNSHAEGAGGKATGDNAHAEGTGTTSSGSCSHAEGIMTTASNAGSHSEGMQTEASGTFSHAEGSSTKASGSQSHAEGASTKATGDQSHSEGAGTLSSGKYAHAEGTFTWAEGEGSHAEGVGESIKNVEGSIDTTTSTYAGGKASHAEGEKTQALGEGSHTEGNGTTASGSFSHAEGTGTKASGTYSHAEGLMTKASNSGSHAEGMQSEASGSFSHAEGSNTKASSGNSHAEGELTQALGKDSHVEGYKSKTEETALYAHAEGKETTASGESSHAEGINSIASGEGSHSEGYAHAIGEGSHAEGGFAIAQGKFSHAEGGAEIGQGATNVFTMAEGDYSHAEGYDTRAIGTSSHAEGHSSSASGNYSHAEGYDTQISEKANSSHAEGSYTKTFGASSHAEGYNTRAVGEDSHAEGSLVKAEGHSSHAEGKYAWAKGDYSHAEGLGTAIDDSEGSVDTTTSTYAGGESSHAEGEKTQALGKGSHTEGWQSSTSTNASYAHAEGYDTDALGMGAHAEGGLTKAAGEYSHAEGSQTQAMEVHSHAEGEKTTTYGKYSHAEGDRSSTYGQSSHAEGQQTTSRGVASHVEGLMSEANGDVSHAEGNHSIASGTNSHAEGDGTTASGGNSHTEGSGTTATSYNDHAEGLTTTASGGASHAEGDSTTAKGNASHAEGKGTIAGSANQHVQGKYNIEDTKNKFAFIIGNGTDDKNRSNLLAIGWDGLFYPNNSEVGIDITKLGGSFELYEILETLPDIDEEGKLDINHIYMVKNEETVEITTKECNYDKYIILSIDEEKNIVWEKVTTTESSGKILVICEELPTLETASTNFVYCLLTPEYQRGLNIGLTSDTNANKNFYEEWIIIETETEKKWELLGPQVYRISASMIDYLWKFNDKFTVYDDWDTAEEIPEYQRKHYGDATPLENFLFRLSPNSSGGYDIILVKETSNGKINKLSIASSYKVTIDGKTYTCNVTELDGTYDSSYTYYESDSEGKVTTKTFESEDEFGIQSVFSGVEVYGVYVADTVKKITRGFIETSNMGIYHIPYGLEVIGDYAFHNTMTPTVQFEKLINDGKDVELYPLSETKIQSIGVHAFDGNSNLAFLYRKSDGTLEASNIVKTPSTLKKIGDYAFFNTRVSTLDTDLSTNLYIGDHAFVRCVHGGQTLSPTTYYTDATFLGVDGLTHDTINYKSDSVSNWFEGEEHAGHNFNFDEGHETDVLHVTLTSNDPDWTLS